jgi:D-glycero-alpha-D-manno-heptose-7-phosphate kinase
MIISRTPLRISLVGGGTDFKDFYQEEPGAVVSTAIDKYMYVTVNRRFEPSIRISYTKTEIVNDLEQMEHELAREVLKMLGIERGIEITSIADIPAEGTGLGSSSAFTVGLLNALHAFRGEHRSADQLAQETCQIEIDILGKPIGKQDQYIIANGGIQYIQFNPDGSVFVDPIIFSEATRSALENNLMLFYLGTKSSSLPILKEQKEKIKKNLAVLREMRQIALITREALFKNSLDQLGGLLDQNWTLKKKLAGGISNQLIDDYYQKAKKAGALGGKLLGAGGRGFLLFYVPLENQDKVRHALLDLRETTFRFEPQGSKIIYVGS